MRRFFSFFMLIVFIFTLNINIIYALDINNTNSLQNVGVNSNLEAQFLSDLGDKTFQINFQDITSNNAGKIIKTWKGKTNIPKKFVLSDGFSLNLNETNLDSYMQKTKKFKEDVEKLNKTAGFKSITQEDIELKLLPDRLQIIQKTTVKFTGKKLVEPSLIEDVLSKKGNGPTEQDLLNNKEVKKLDLQQDLTIPDNADELLINEIVKDCKNNSSELPSQLKGNCTFDSIKTRFENIEKDLTTEEKVEISIIPPSFNDVTKKVVLSKNPSDMRITKNEIQSRFETYKKIQKTKNTYTLKYKGKFFTLDQSKFDTFQKSYNQKFQLQNSNTGAVIGGGVSYNESTDTVIGGGVSYQEETPYIYEDVSTCDRYANIQDKNGCIELFNEKQNATIVKYNQMLLNGFTLGQADSVSWSKSLSAFGYKVFKARVEVGYSYGFGIRIPMSAEVNLGKNIVDDYREGGKINNDYSFDLKVNTHDFSKQDYKNVGIKENQLFEGNEFVLELDAYLDAGIYLRGIIDKNYHISLVDTVVRAILTYAGFTEEAIDLIVTPDKGFNKSSSFTPPFAGDNNVDLMNIIGTYPFVDTSYLVLKGGVELKASIDGSIELDCQNINSNGGCSSNIRFDSKNKKSYTGSAVFNENIYNIDKLGAYSSFGPKLDNFQYIPELVFKMLAYGVVKAKVPVLDEWYSYTTPKWELYTFSVDMASLGTHEGTNGVVDATLNNKVYTAYKNPIPIFQNYSNNIKGVETVYVDKNEVDTIVDDSLIEISEINNMKGFNRVIFSTDGTDPNCSSTNILSYRQNKIWPNSKNELLNNKNITLKTISCDMFGNKTGIKTNTYQVRNTYFEPQFKIKGDIVQGLKLPMTLGNNTKSYIYYNKTIDSTVDGLEIFANNYSNGNGFIVYTLDGTNPTCLPGGTSNKYTGKIPRNILDSFKQEAEKTTSNGIITVKSAQCINLSGKQTFKSNISTLTLDILSSSLEEGINGINGTNSNLLGQGMGNLLNGNGISGNLIDGLGDDIGGNAGGPQIGTMNIDYNGDGIERKYASTRMTGCDENDIILGDKVWASCNSNYYLDYSKIYKNTDEISTDINGWNLGRLYTFSNQVCPAGYKIPTKDDFFGLNQYDYGTTIIKLPYAGYGYNGGASTISYSGKDSYANYWTNSNSNETSKGWIATISAESNRLVSVQTLSYTELNKYFMPLRCIRSTPATFEEKNGDLSLVNTGLTMTGGLFQNNFGSGYNNSYGFLKQTEELTSKDEYVNEKLSEINNCFVDNYNYHLANLNSTIEKLKLEKDKQTNVNDIRKYQLAIEKLEEIKKLFIIRYGSIINLSND